MDSTEEHEGLLSRPETVEHSGSSNCLCVHCVGCVNAVFSFVYCSIFEPLYVCLVGAQPQSATSSPPSRITSPKSDAAPNLHHPLPEQSYSSPSAPSRVEFLHGPPRSRPLVSPHNVALGEEADKPSVLINTVVVTPTVNTSSIKARKTGTGAFHASIARATTSTLSSSPTTRETTADIISAMETDRSVLRSLEQLVAVLERCAEYLPVRVEAELEDPIRSAASSVSSTSSPPSPVCRVCLQVFGPVRAAPHAALLGVVEDILLEDCAADCLRVSAIHFADLAFSGDADVPATAAARVGSNGSLDIFPPLGGAETPVAVLRECRDRVRAFAKNLLESAASAETIHLTRCSFTPSDLGRGLKLPILRLRRLLFEMCPMSGAHVDAFVRLAKAENRRSRGTRALQRLVELQLSGALTEDAIGALLAYFDEDLQEGEVNLVTLRLPSLWLRVARASALFEHHPNIILSGT